MSLEEKALILIKSLTWSIGIRLVLASTLNAISSVIAFHAFLKLTDFPSYAYFDIDIPALLPFEILN